MLPFCAEKADFVWYIYQTYDFVTEHISKLFWWIYQLIPCTITNFADKYSEVLNWISCLNIITKLPCWTISELILSTEVFTVPHVVQSDTTGQQCLQNPIFLVNFCIIFRSLSGCNTGHFPTRQFVHRTF